MKTILKEGPTIFYCRCAICGTLFTYEIDDIILRLDAAKNTEYYAIICPKCTAINKHNVVNSVKEKEENSIVKNVREVHYTPEELAEELENDITVKELKR